MIMAHDDNPISLCYQTSESTHSAFEDARYALLAR
jgi:hypothetical protein